MPYNTAGSFTNSCFETHIPTLYVLPLWSATFLRGQQGPGSPKDNCVPALTHIHQLELGTHCVFPCAPSVPGRTIWEIRVTELEILAGTSWVMLSAQWMLHLLNFQFQGIQWAENLLHAICIVHVVVSISIVHQLAGIDVSPGPLGRLDGQRLDDFSRRTLMDGGRRCNFSVQMGMRQKKQPKQPLVMESSITRHTLDIWVTHGAIEENPSHQHWFLLLLFSSHY